MKLVGAVLRDHLNLRTAEPAHLRVIRIGDDLHFLNRVRVRRNNGCRAPRDARNRHTVQRDAICVVTASIARNLRAVLRIVRTRARSHASGTLVARHRIRASTAALRAIAKHARRQTSQLHRIAPEVRHLRQIILRDRAADAARPGVHHRQLGGIHRHGLCRSTNLQHHVECVRLLGDEFHVVQNLLLEPVACNRQGVRARRKLVEHEIADFVAAN